MHGLRVFSNSQWNNCPQCITPLIQKEVDQHNMQHTETSAEVNKRSGFRWESLA